jgi:formyl-CoA transferase
VPSGRIYNVRDIAEDPHYKARNAISRVRSASGIDVDMPGVVPLLSENPGAIQHRAPQLGEHTAAVLEEAGLDPSQLEILGKKGVIA